MTCKARRHTNVNLLGKSEHQGAGASHLRFPYLSPASVLVIHWQPSLLLPPLPLCLCYGRYKLDPRLYALITHTQVHRQAAAAGGVQVRPSALRIGHLLHPPRGLSLPRGIREGTFRLYWPLPSPPCVLVTSFYYPLRPFAELRSTSKPVQATFFRTLGMAVY